MKKVIVFGTAGAEEIELVTIVDVLRRVGIQVTLICLDEGPGTFKCANGVMITADSNSLPSQLDMDAVVFPGGSKAAITFAESPQIQKFIKAVFDKNILIAAICASPKALSAAGILKGRSATIYPSMESCLVNGGAKVVLGDAVVVDGNIVTSRGPGTAIAFACKLVELLIDVGTCKQVRSDLLFE